MVEWGMSPEVIDAMDLPDLVGWYHVMAEYQREIVKNRPKPKPRT